MNSPSATPSNSSARDVPSDAGYVSSLAPRPHALTPPGAQPSRWTELRASLAWIASSWRRPADADAVWEQRAGREDRTP